MIAKSPVPFLTSDRPILLHERQDLEDSWRGVGLGTADMIIFPLDRHRVLIMQHPLPEHHEGIVTISARHARVINSAVANHSRRWLFHHPEDNPIGDIPFNPRGRREQRQM